MMFSTSTTIQNGRNKMRSFMLKLVAASLVLAGMPATVFADAASEVIAVTKAQWAAQIEKETD